MVDPQNVKVEGLATSAGSFIRTMMTKQIWVEEEADPREVERGKDLFSDLERVDKPFEGSSLRSNSGEYINPYLPTYHFEQEQAVAQERNRQRFSYRASSFSVSRYRLRQPVSPHFSIDIDIQQLHRISSSISTSQTHPKTCGKRLERNETFAFRLFSFYRYENHVARHYRSTTTSPSPGWRYSCRSIRAWSQEQQQSQQSEPSKVAFSGERWRASRRRHARDRGVPLATTATAATSSRESS